MNRPNLDRYIAGWRGPVLAALLALIAGLPGLLQTRSLSRYGLSQVTVVFRDGKLANQAVGARPKAGVLALLG